MKMIAMQYDFTNRDYLMRLISVTLSVFVLIFLIWVLGVLVVYPYFGFNYYPEGYIYIVEPNIEFESQIEVGDYLLAIDGISISKDWLGSDGFRSGDTVELLVKKNDRSVLIEYPVPNLPANVLTYRLVPILIALIFLISGLVVVVRNPKLIISWLFFLLTTSGCLVLVAGTLTAIGIFWSNFPYYSSLLVVSVLSIHFHLYFPVRVRIPYMRLFIFAMYSLTFLGSLLVYQALFTSESLILIKFLSDTGGRLIVLSSFTVIIFILLYSYFSGSTPSKRAKIRIVTFGGVIATVPLTFLSILPHLIIGHPLLSYDLSIFPLAILPISYGYSIFKHQLTPLNKEIIKSSILVFNSVFIIAAYLLLMVAIGIFLPQLLLEQPALLFLIILILAAVFTPLRNLTKTTIERIIIGRGYDLTWIISSSTRMVTETLDVTALADHLYSILRKLNFSAVALIIPETNYYKILFQVGFSPSDLESFGLIKSGVIAQKLREGSDALWINELKKSCQVDELDSSEFAFISIDSSILIAPLSGRAEARGFLILKSELDQEWSSREDETILSLLIHIVSVAVENIQLINLVNERRGDILRVSEIAHQRNRVATDETEDEFKAIARELHDGPIQDLVGFGFDLKKIEFLSAEQEGNYESKLNSIIRELREICTTLRPASIYMGIPTAIQSLTIRYQESHSHVQFHLNIPEISVELTSELNLAVYRIAQEAVNNVIQHANAHNVWITCESESGEIRLVVQDDGRGFVPPEDMFQLAAAGHFGMIGMYERVQSVGGSLEITSSPGKGTCLRVTATIPEEKSADMDALKEEK